MATYTLESPSNCDAFPWMRTVFQEYKQSSWSGKNADGTPKTNPRVMEYFTATDYKPKLEVGDEEAWCSAFVNWVMNQYGIIGTGKANARSWERWGQWLTTPTYGCIAVLWREDKKRKISINGGLGHVAFYTGEEGSSLVLVGGNQNRQVGIKNYSATQLLSYRWPMNFPLPK